MTPPVILTSILSDTEALGFTMASEPLTGSLLRTLAASKPGGAFLELGTGTGVGAAWLLDGMDNHSRLTSIDNDAAVVAVARQWLGDDPRVTFLVQDGGEYLLHASPSCFDLIFADSWPGKFTHLDEALAALKPGGLYVIDDLLPQPNWPSDHAPKVPRLIAGLEARRDLVLTRLDWASGVIVATKR